MRVAMRPQKVLWIFLIHISPQEPVTRSFFYLQIFGARIVELSSQWLPFVDLGYLLSCIRAASHFVW